MRIDTADPASIEFAAKEVLARHPDLNVLVMTAGIMQVEDWHQPPRLSWPRPSPS